MRNQDDSRDRFAGGVACRALLSCAVGVLAVLSASAQVVTSRRPEIQTSEGSTFYSIEGKVVAPDSRSPINQARVYLTDLRGRQLGTFITDDEGTFAFYDLPTGVYSLNVTHPQYEEANERAEITVSAIYGMRIILKPRAGATPAGTAPTGQTLPVWAQEIPSDARKEYQKGVQVLKDNKEECVRHLEAAVKIYPRYASAFAALGAAQLGMGKRKEAMDAFEHAVEIDENLPDANLGLGALYNAEKRPEEAEKVLLRARLVKPDDWRVHYELGEAQVQMEQWANAETSLRQAVELHNSFARAHLLLINALSMQDKYPESLAAMEEYLRLLPKDSFAAQVRKKRDMLKEHLAKQAPPSQP